jgi:hypothetical protein
MNAYGAFFFCLMGFAVGYVIGFQLLSVKRVVDSL